MWKWWCSIANWRIVIQFEWEANRTRDRKADSLPADAWFGMTRDGLDGRFGITRFRLGDRFGIEVCGWRRRRNEGDDSGGRAGHARCVRLRMIVRKRWWKLEGGRCSRSR